MNTQVNIQKNPSRNELTLRDQVKISEIEFQQSVIELAHLHHWKCAHFRPAMTGRIGRNNNPVWVTPVQADGQGFPDLVLVRNDQVIFAELKSETGKMSAAQRQWYIDLSAVAYMIEDHVTVDVWRPSDWEKICRILE